MKCVKLHLGRPDNFSHSHCIDLRNRAGGAGGGGVDIDTLQSLRDEHDTHLFLSVKKKKEKLQRHPRSLKPKPPFFYYCRTSKQQRRVHTAPPPPPPPSVTDADSSEGAYIFNAGFFREGQEGRSSSFFFFFSFLSYCSLGILLLQKKA